MLFCSAAAPRCQIFQGVRFPFYLLFGLYLPFANICRLFSIFITWRLFIHYLNYRLIMVPNLHAVFAPAAFWIPAGPLQSPRLQISIMYRIYIIISSWLAAAAPGGQIFREILLHYKSLKVLDYCKFGGILHNLAGHSKTLPNFSKWLVNNGSWNFSKSHFRANFPVLLGWLLGFFL